MSPGAAMAITACCKPSGPGVHGPPEALPGPGSDSFFFSSPCMAVPPGSLFIISAFGLQSGGGGCVLATGKSGEREGGGEIREYMYICGYMFSLFSHCLLEIYSTKSAVSCQLFYSTAPIKFLFFKYFFHLCVQFMFSSPSLL